MLGHTSLVHHQELEHLQFDLVDAGQNLLLLVDGVHLLTLAQDLKQLSHEFFEASSGGCVVKLSFLGKPDAKVSELGGINPVFFDVGLKTRFFEEVRDVKVFPEAKLVPH